jgi:hypothetical protein
MTDDLEPPFLLDGARILEYGSVARPAGGRASVVVNGVGLDPGILTRVAIVRTLQDDTLFILHCNDRWETIAAEPHADSASARDAAAVAYGPNAVSWRAFRALTDEESREIESTRVFLRELIAGELSQ